MNWYSEEYLYHSPVGVEGFDKLLAAERRIIYQLLGVGDVLYYIGGYILLQIFRKIEYILIMQIEGRLAYLRLFAQLLYGYPFKVLA